MRRISFVALLMLVVAVAAAGVRAQSQDPLITSARQFSQQGNFDTAITMLRSGLATRPADAALRQALLDVLVMKQDQMTRDMRALQTEITSLRNGDTGATTGCSGAPIKVGSGIAVPEKRKDVKPEYPADAMAARVKGVVIMEIRVDCEGKVARAQLLRGVPVLNDAALAAVKQWEYVPTLLNGKPVPVSMTVTVSFSPRD